MTVRTHRSLLGVDFDCATSRSGRAPVGRSVLGLVGNRAAQRLLRPTAVQRADVDLYNGHQPLIERPTALMATIKAVLEKGEARGGASRTGTALTRLEEIELAAAAEVPSSQATYGMSAIVGGGPEEIFVQGPVAYFEAVQKVAPGAKHIGSRKAGVHDEVTHLRHRADVQAIKSSQPNCLFCYGLLEKRSRQHGDLRDTAFPQRWTHDKSDFEIVKTNASMGYSAKRNPVLVITTDLAGGPGYYRVERGA